MSDKGTGKKIVKFLFLGDAITQRNLTTLLLVFLLFVVFYLAGGRIEAVPKVPRDARFGSVENKATDSGASAKPAANQGVQNTSRQVGVRNARKTPVTEGRKVQPRPRSQQEATGNQENPFADIQRRLREGKRNN